MDGEGWWSGVSRLRGVGGRGGGVAREHVIGGMGHAKP